MTEQHFSQYLHFIIPFYSLWFFRNSHWKLFFFFFGFFIAILVIIISKALTKLPVPHMDINKFYILKRIPDYFDKLVSYNMFEMPWELAILTTFSFVFFSLSSQQINYFSLCYTILLLFSKFIEQHHHCAGIQLFVGCGIGSLIAFATYMYCYRFLEGPQNEKTEDF